MEELCNHAPDATRINPQRDIVLEALMLKIEVEANGAGRHIRLIGRVRAENIDDLSRQIAASDEPTTLDLREVTIVDLAAVRFLLSCEKNELKLLNCSLYIREWMAREQGAHGT